ncbi:SMP-30/gluconolactonase/LRE family protein [Candidatus Latescibacterota bacterium]
MLNRESETIGTIWMIMSAVLVLLLAIVGCADNTDSWQSLNKTIIEQNNIPQRTRTDIPKGKTFSHPEPGIVVGKVSLSDITLAEGVTGKIFWGGNAMVSILTLAPGTEIPGETLAADRIMVVRTGSLEQLVDGAYVGMKAVQRIPIHHERENGWQPINEFIYLQKGSQSGVKAGPEGCEILEIYSPLRLDYITKAGREVPADIPESSFSVQLPFDPNTIYDMYDVQFSKLGDGVFSKILPAPGFQVSFMSMDPGTELKLQSHPESMLRMVLRGSMDATVLDQSVPMGEGDTIFLPGDMVHGEKAGALGCDMLDIYSPGNPDLEKSMTGRLAAYHAIVPEGEKPQLIYDGATREIKLKFAEGPSWMDGRLYFSSMHYDNFSVWPGNPKKSKLVSIKPDGSDPRLLQQGMQTNGTMPLGNGNLAVCDMYGHRIVEMTPFGKIVRTIATEGEGKRLDGPNDMAILPNGGMFFTDPQIVPPPLMQPGPSVYYRSPKGNVKRVIAPGAFAVPNGLILRHDSKVLYVNNTYDDETHISDKDNYIWAYDVNEDGSLSNERAFCALFVTPHQRTLGYTSTSSDGMVVDMEGNLYDCSFYGVQIFDVSGEFIGMINTPLVPINAKFGGDDMQTLFVVCYDKVYTVRTNVKGVKYPLK